MKELESISSLPKQYDRDATEHTRLGEKRAETERFVLRARRDCMVVPRARGKRGIGQSFEQTQPNFISRNKQEPLYFFALEFVG